LKLFSRIPPVNRAEPSLISTTASASAKEEEVRLSFSTWKQDLIAFCFIFRFVDIIIIIRRSFVHRQRTTYEQDQLVKDL
jgi:hypothetical protein